MCPPLAIKLVSEVGSEKWLPWSAAGEKNPQKRPTFGEGGMFRHIGKSYIWMLEDIPDKRSRLRIRSGLELGLKVGRGWRIEILRR